VGPRTPVFPLEVIAQRKLVGHDTKFDWPAGPPLSTKHGVHSVCAVARATRERTVAKRIEKRIVEATQTM
jgi:hypothetical protein